MHHIDPMDTEDVVAARGVHVLLAVLAAALGGVLLAGGIYLALRGKAENGMPTVITLFGNQFSSASVGVAMAFIGVVMIVMVFRRILASIDRLASLR